MSTATATKWSNGRRRGRNGYAGRHEAPLTATQKAALCMLCREAYEHLGGQAKLFVTLDQWRHEVVQYATGKAGLRECAQGDYRAIQAQLLDLKGEAGRAMSAHVEHQTEPLRVARHKLAEALREKGLGEGYVGTICRSRFKCGLDQANAKQVWQLVFTIRGR